MLSLVAGHPGRETHMTEEYRLATPEIVTDLNDAIKLGRREVRH